MGKVVDVLLNIGSIYSSIANIDPKKQLSIIDGAFQSASSAVSIAAAAACIKKGKPNPSISVVSIITGYLALGTGCSVLGTDWQDKKFEKKDSVYLFVADISTIFGDITSIMSGMLGVFQSEYGPALNAISGLITGFGIYAQYEWNKSELSEKEGKTLLTGLSRSISLLKNGSLEFSSSLENSKSPFLADWKSTQTRLFTLLDSVSGAINASDDVSFEAKVAATVAAVDDFRSFIPTTLQSFVNANPSLSSADDSEANSLLTTSYAQSGYYIVQPGDTDDSILSALSMSRAWQDYYGDITVLKRINAALGVTSITTPGTLLHIPQIEPVDGTSFEGLGRNGVTYVFDVSMNRSYTVGSSSDGPDIGALIIDVALNGQYATFDKGTWSSCTAQADGSIVVGVTTCDGAPVGTLTFNASTHAGTFTLSSGYTIAIPAGQAIHLTDPDIPTINVVLGYLQELGITMTAAQLDSNNYNYLHPTGAAYVVTPLATGDKQYTFRPTAAGAIMTGVAGAYNIIEPRGDLTRDTFSNIQEIRGDATLTAAQCAAVSKLSGKYNCATGGTYDFRKGTSAEIKALDWSGTTIYAPNDDYVVVTASEFGNDTLIAGAGTRQVLIAGKGIDTLTGSASGGTTFYAGMTSLGRSTESGLSDGSKITGYGSNNTLVASGDITGATITGVQTLQTFGGVTLTADEFNSFNTFTDAAGVGINAAHGGVYDLSQKTVKTTYPTVGMVALTDEGTTLIGATNVNSYLWGSVAGDDTLSITSGYVWIENTFGSNRITIGNTADNNVYADGCYGNNTITVGSGGGNAISLKNSWGNNTITSGGRDLVYLDNSGGDNIVNLAGGGTLTATYSSGNNVFTLGSANNNTVNIEYSSGNNSIILGAANNNRVDIGYSSGNNSINFGSGTGVDFGAYQIDGDLSITLGKCDGANLSVYQCSGNISITAGDGVGQIFDFNNFDASVTIKAGNGGNTFNWTNYGDGVGLASFYSGTGNDTFNMGVLQAGCSISGGGGVDTLIAYGDMYKCTVAGISVLKADYVALNANQMSQFSSIVADDPIQTWHQIDCMTSGTFSLAGKGTQRYDLYAQTNNGTTLVGNDADNEELYASDTGTDTLKAGNGKNVVLHAGSGINTLIGGAGSTTFICSDPVAGTMFQGGAGINTLSVWGDITKASLSGKFVLETYSVTLTADQLKFMSSITSGGSDYAKINAAGGGTYSIAGMTTSGVVQLIANKYAETGTTLIGNGASNVTLISSWAGNDTLQAGNGAGSTLVGYGGYDTMIGGTGADVFALGYGGGAIQGNGGANKYTFEYEGYGTAWTINNYHTDTAASTVQFVKIASTAALCTRSGNNLVLKMVDYDENVTIQNFFMSAQYQIASVKFSDGITWTTADLIAKGANAVGKTYKLTTGTDTVTGSAYDDTVIATSGTLMSGDKIDAAGGDDTLALQGGGTFDLRSPSTLNNIETVTAQEGQAAYGTIANTRQTVYLRNNLYCTVNVASATVNPSNPNAAGITIYGGTGGQVINLGKGNDTVYLACYCTEVHGGGGNNTFYANASTIGAVIDGGTGASTLNVTGGGTVTMSDTVSRIATVNLQAASAAYTFRANNIAGMTINGTAAADTITVGAATQKINAGAGNDRIIVNAATAGALISGGDGTNTLQITGGGTAILNAKNTGITTVQLDAATNVTLGTQTTTAVTGSSGNDTITLTAASTTRAINGGAGTDTLIAYGNISAAALSNVELLTINGSATMSLAQFNAFKTISTGSSSSTATLTGTTAGTYDLSAKTLTGIVNFIGSSGSDTLKAGTTTTSLSGGAGNDTLTANATGTALHGGTGTNILNGGIGADTLYIEGTSDKAYGGAGNDIIYVTTSSLSGTTIDGGIGTDTLTANASTSLSGATIANMEALNLNSKSVTMSATQFGLFSTLSSGSSTATATIIASAAGTYNLSTKTVTGNINLTGSSGNDVITGNASAQTLIGNAGADTLDGKGGNDTLNGGKGNDTYIFGVGYGNDTISDYDTTTGNADKLNFATGLSKSNLWFTKSGYDLVVNVLGKTDTVKISNWYKGAAYDLESFTTTDGYKLDSKLASLVSAMASYSTSHAGFNPAATSVMPADTTLQNAITASWHK